MDSYCLLAYTYCYTVSRLFLSCLVVVSGCNLGNFSVQSSIVPFLHNPSLGMMQNHTCPNREYGRHHAPQCARGAGAAASMAPSQCWRIGKYRAHAHPCPSSSLAQLAVLVPHSLSAQVSARTDDGSQPLYEKHKRKVAVCTALPTSFHIHMGAGSNLTLQ